MPQSSPADTSSSSAGATPATPRAAAPSATSRRWPPGWSSVAAGSRSSASRTPARAPDETVDGIRFVRRGSKLSVYPLGHVGAAAPPARDGRRRRRRPERPAVLQHPGHPRAGHRAGPPRPPRAVAGRLPRADRPGRLVDREPPRAAALPAPAVRRRVPRATRAELRELGVTGPRIAVVHNGTDPVVSVDARKSRQPVDLRGRPAGAAQAGRARDRRRRRACSSEFPDLRLRVVGSGWWEAELHAYAAGPGRPGDRSSSRVMSPSSASRRSTRSPG